MHQGVYRLIKMKKLNNKQNGYTIIETMISVSLFIIVIMSGMGSLLNANLLHLKSQDIRSIMDNLSFVMEDISRNLRVGTVYHCDEGSLPRDTAKSCPSGAFSIVFKPYKGGLATYRFKDGHIELDDGINSVAITAPEVVITNTKFIVTGTDAGDNKQPKILMTIQGYAGVKLRDQTNFNLQTTITQRILDF